MLEGIEDTGWRWCGPSRERACVRACVPLRGLMEVGCWSYVADVCGARKGRSSVEGVVGMVVGENEGVASERIEQAGGRGGERVSGCGG